ncbi:MAG: putative sulfate exporter family transporter [Candidatus Hydrothermarchaeota archaeon]|nr:putative sulfate exporter family transporter [Candidatus Hydrothermarchaeota archaeon]
MAEEKIDWSSLWKSEDWWSVWVGFFILLVFGIAGLVKKVPKIGAWTTNPLVSIKAAEIPLLIYLMVGLVAITIVGIYAMKLDLKGYVTGFPVIFIIAILSFVIAANKTVKGYGLEYVLWALFIGLFISNILRVPSWLKTAVRTEYFIKIGLVLLGAEILFHVIMKAGFYGMAQALIMVFCVWYFCYFLAIRAGLTKSFAAVLSTGVSICGVSAAIASGGAIKADKKEVSYVISIVLVCAIPMLVFMPMIAKAVAMPDAVAGAWLGGTIDTTGAVVAAGAIFSKKAMEIASIVKMSQNVLVGFAAFLLALYWTLRVERKPEETPKAIEIWYRFPKFIVGFVLASIAFSFILIPAYGETAVKAILGITKTFRNWFFCMAFVAIGLDTNFRELLTMGGGRPAIVFLTAQIFNIFLTLVLAYALFGGIFFPAPV